MRAVLPPGGDTAKACCCWQEKHGGATNVGSVSLLPLHAGGLSPRVLLLLSLQWEPNAGLPLIRR